MSCESHRRVGLSAMFGMPKTYFAEGCFYFFKIPPPGVRHRRVESKRGSHRGNSNSNRRPRGASWGRVAPKSLGKREAASSALRLPENSKSRSSATSAIDAVSAYADCNRVCRDNPGSGENEQQARERRPKEKNGPVPKVKIKKPSHSHPTQQHVMLAVCG
jgi:hypothetical protein